MKTYIVPTSAAQQNIAKLPGQCFAVLQSTNEIIVIKAGESGYYQPAHQPRKFTSYDQASAFADELNKDSGIDKGEREAMESGSMFGWEIPAADADNYEDAGNYSPKK